MAPLSSAQQIVLISLSTTSGCLSMCGSICIVILALQRRQQGTYHRLLLTMSLIDIFHSIAIVFNPFLLPKNPDRIWSIGNDRTCSMAGFFAQLSSSVSFYNAMLNLNYLLTIRCGMDSNKLTKWVEPWMHALSIIYPLCTATLGVSVGMFSELELGQACWISDYPRGCEEDPNVDCTGQVFGWIFSGIPLLSTLAFLLISNILIYLKVREIVAKQRRFSVSMDDSIRRKKQDVGTQASLYVAACFNTVIWLVVIRTLESLGVHREDESSVFHLLILTSFFYPLQGFWNLLIYVRPRYMRWRRREPDLSRWFSFRQALHPNPMLSEHFISMHSSHHHGNRSVSRIIVRQSLSRNSVSRHTTVSDSGENSAEQRMESSPEARTTITPSLDDAYLDDSHLFRKGSKILSLANTTQQIVDPKAKMTLDEMFQQRGSRNSRADEAATQPTQETHLHHDDDVVRFG
uniref:G-protein coupled receptors family 1 profile domain-containing protein n=1 Tax=Cyclophora tenuis TaxID=216820 RepID=A0A7S1D3Y8_CYCTE|mmetsp:Transcript_2166/g.3790  ORF Transcript_2166/g.3790 Transcript_2166/m.3790 type:complete len:461 (+) Transcript_2166:93-1475(+)